MTNLFSHKLYYEAAIIMCCFFVCSCENSMQEVNDLSKKKIGKDIAEDVTSYMSQGAHVKAKLTSPLMTRTEADTAIIEFPKTLQVEFYDDSTKPESHLFANYGKYFEQQGKVFLKDSVIVFNIKGDTLLTNELWWDRDKEIFYTDKKVWINQKDNQKFIGENGMQADQSFKEWTLFQGSGIRNVPDSTLPQ
ncbi:LPS export ABC transporter periplasmic protein LptC [Panacibacter ginsenosidivorans]|uniref:LPS export ABC transporter periplasmic protein LptC n=1 Tax=Panacibacter ginsenosidivorans TaxID=1813871 RepID=A0A5B8V7L3_9BACT|nr:LPS export ABC transporter periplasmic protein LptC [Panacibacter ginsenosidivorans]QEC67477.1 LPS export ABC transporter periplasmic protein LptC [Panacibacter ginsenosidivorans]